jgi:small subunit ribosomal protein S17
MPKRTLTGIVVSDKMDKTVVVRVERIKEHPIYRRRYKLHTKYKAHDESNQYKTGEKVVIQECKPFSKDKKWEAVSKIAK